MEYKRMKLTKEDVNDGEEVDVIAEIGNKFWHQNPKFGDSNIIFLVEYCQLWCHVEPLKMDEDSDLLKQYFEAIKRREAPFGSLISWNNSWWAVVVADNAKQAVQFLLDEVSKQ